MKVRIRKVRDPVYKHRVFLVTGPAKDIHEWFKKHHDYWTRFDNCAGRFVQLEGPPEKLFICIPDNKYSKAQVIAVIAHECLEAAEAILLDSGLKLNDDSHEALNYLTEYFVLQVAGLMIK